MSILFSSSGSTNIPGLIFPSSDPNEPRSDEINDKIENGPQLIFVAGRYYLDKPLRIPHSKSILCLAAGMKTGYITQSTVSPNPEPYRLNEDVRFWTDQNINMVEITSANVRWVGGTFDTQQIANHDKNIFYMPAVGADPFKPRRARGWGVELLDFSVLGSSDTLVNTTGLGTTAVLVEMEPNTYNNGYWCMIKARMLLRGCHTGWKATARDPEYSHWTNSHQVYIECDHTKQAIHDLSSSSSEFYVHHQSRNIFNNQQEIDETYSVTLGRGGNFIDARFADFGKVDRNAKTLNIAPGNYFPNPKVHNHHVTPPAANIGDPADWIMMNPVDNKYHAATPLIVETFAELLDPNSPVNTGPKSMGMMVWVRSERKPYFSNGNNPDAGWRDANGTYIQSN